MPTRWQTCRTVSSMSHMLAAHIASSISGSAASSSRARSAAAFAAAAACNARHCRCMKCPLRVHAHMLGNADTCLTWRMRYLWHRGRLRAPPAVSCPTPPGPPQRRPAPRPPPQPRPRVLRPNLAAAWAPRRCCCLQKQTHNTLNFCHCTLLVQHSALTVAMHSSATIEQNMAAELHI